MLSPRAPVPTQPVVQQTAREPGDRWASSAGCGPPPPGDAAGEAFGRHLGSVRRAREPFLVSIVGAPGCARRPALTVPMGGSAALRQLCGSERLPWGCPLHPVEVSEPVVVCFGGSDKAPECG